MAIIHDDIIKPKAIVEKTIFHVFNWGKNDGSNNVELIGLEFNDGSYISYATEMYLDLPNGDYELIDGNYVKISEDEDISEEPLMVYEIDPVKEAKDYINYLIENATKFMVDTKELLQLLQDVTINNHFKITREAERIAIVINDKATEILDSQSQNIKIMKQYFEYLQGHTEQIFESFSDMVNDTNFNFIKEQSEKFADTLQKMENFIADLKK